MQIYALHQHIQIFVYIYMVTRKAECKLVIITISYALTSFSIKYPFYVATVHLVGFMPAGHGHGVITRIIYFC